MNWNYTHDHFLKFSALLGAILYTAPAATFVALLNHYEVAHGLIIEILLVYIVGALAHILSWGFQAINVQIVTSTDAAMAELSRPKG